MKHPRIILASASPRRASLLRQIGLRFRVVPSCEPEPDLRHLSPRELEILELLVYFLAEDLDRVSQYCMLLRMK